jgi:Mn2+/Fe2+ NRAMP family transporter
VGVIGIVVYAEMAGRVAAISGRPVFNLVRERLGPAVGLANLVASFFINFLTLTAELAGVAIAVSLVASVHYVLLLPVAAFLVWLVIWRLPFEWMERVFGLLGLLLAFFIVAVAKAGPDWGELFHQASHPAVPRTETPFTYAYFAIALFGAAMTPYEVFFFSSGAVEEGWRKPDLMVNRANVYLGFPLGGALSLVLMAGAAVFLEPAGIEPSHLSDVALPTLLVLGKVGLALILFSFFILTFGAAIETGLSCGYSVAQFYGWQWGKFVRPLAAARFHVVTLLSILVGALLILTTLDPIKVTEYSIVFSAAALPLTYLPILLVANDPDYMQDKVNSRFTNAVGMFYLVLFFIVMVATVPLMIVTKAGQ